MLVSVGGKGQDASLLVPYKGTTSYAFPVKSDDEPFAATYQSLTGQLLELVVLSESGDCPHVLLRRADGHFHTGDLFPEPEPGKYLYQGQRDDWIKRKSSSCDTK